MTEGDEKIMVRKILNKVVSSVTTTLLAFTTLASAIPVTTYAAAASNTIQKSTTLITNKNKAQAAGYGTFDFNSDSSGYTFSHSSNLTKADKSDWIWSTRDQGASDSSLKTKLGDAYIAKLNPDKSFWVEYKNVKKVDDEGNQLGTYDVKVVFDNASGEVSGADGKDIAIFSGQLGAVRFRGYKRLRCSLYVYEHGTTNLISGTNNRLHFRFIDIDCNQAVESMCPGRTDWYMMGSKLSWAGEPRCTKIGAEQGNTVTFKGEHDTPDAGIQGTLTEQRTARRYTWSVGFTPVASSDFTYRVRYYSGGIEDIGTQKNGAFFSFDGGLTLPAVPDDSTLSIDKVSDKFTHKVGDTWDYTIRVKNVSDEGTAVTAKDVEITDNVPSTLRVNSVSTSQGTASHNGNAVSVSAGDLTQDATVTVKVNVTALEASNNTRPYNTAKATASNGSNDDGWEDDDGNYVNSADVQVDKVVDKYEYKVGETANFTVKVKNTKGVAENLTVADVLPSGMKLNYDSVQISGLPASVAMPIAANDVTNQLNPDLFQKTETKNITANKVKNGDNGWAYKINYLPAGSTATITFSATALEAGNEKEEQNVATATGDNFSKAEDDAEYYINSANLEIDKVVDKYEYQVGEEASYTVKVKNTKGVAENLTVADVLPSGMKLNYDSLKISGLPANVPIHVAGTPDVTNQLNPDKYNETETKDITANKEKNGDNGWNYKINYMPANTTAVITFTATATEDGNGKEQQNVVTATGDNFSKVEDDAEYYVNTPKLTLSKKYINPYKEEKKDNRCDNEFRIFEKETGYEKVQYEVLAKNTAPEGTVAKDVVISDVTLPEGLALNYDSIKISEISASGTKTFSKASGGNGNTIKYRIAGTPDETNKLNPEHYNETEDRTPVITVEKQGNGFIVRDSLMLSGTTLKITYDANALENDKVDVNGSEIRNEATATASNLAKVDGKVPTLKADTTVYINSPRLKIEKNADSGDYEVGDNVSYTINVVNTHKGTIARNLKYTDELKTKGVQILTGTIALYDTDGYELREGGTLAGEVDYKKLAKVDGFTLTTRKHLVVDDKYNKYDLAQGKNPETQDSWNPPYVNTEKETLMSIKYDMKITDKALAGKDILNVATAVSDEALKVTTDETVTPRAPEPTPEKSVDRTNPKVGEDVTFTLRFTNTNAGTKAENVKIKDFMSESNMVKIREDSIKVTFDNEDITKDCKITYNDSKDGFEIETGKDLAQSQAIVVTYKAEVLIAASGKDLVNTDGVSCNNNPEWKYAEAPFSPEDPTPELKIEKKSDKASYNVGDTGHYTVKVTQTADDAIARNVVIEDNFKNEKAILDTKTIKIQDYKGNDITKDVTIEGTQSSYKIETKKNLAQNEFFTVSYDVLFTDPTLGGEEITNVAKTHADNVPEKETEVTVPIEKPELEVTKTSDKKIYSYEDTAHYTVKTEEVKENATAYNVVIQDQLQVSGAKVLAKTVKISDKDGKDFTDKCEIKCDGTGYTIKTKRDLAKGEVFTVNYDVVFEDRSLIDNYVPNVVKVTADNASAQTEHDVTPKTVKTEDGAEYQILKSCQPASGSVVNVGDEIEYTITVNNTGKKDLKDVRIKDAIPTHTKYASGGTLTKNNHAVKSTKGTALRKLNF